MIPMKLSQNTTDLFGSFIYEWVGNYIIEDLILNHKMFASA